MTETATETVDQNEATPFVEDDREIAYRSEATPQVSHGPAGRPAIVAPSAATGRRKEAVARVRLVPGSGQWTINGRTLDEYFPNKLHQQLVSEPFAAAAVSSLYDVMARIHGGGVTGQRPGTRRRGSGPSKGRRIRDGRGPGSRPPGRGTRSVWSGPCAGAVAQGPLGGRGAGPEGRPHQTPGGADAPKSGGGGLDRELDDDGRRRPPW